MTPEQYEQLMFSLTRIAHSLERIAVKLEQPEYVSRDTPPKRGMAKPSMYTEVRKK